MVQLNIILKSLGQEQFFVTYIFLQAKFRGLFGQRKINLQKYNLDPFHSLNNLAMLFGSWSNYLDVQIFCCFFVISDE